MAQEFRPRAWGGRLENPGGRQGMRAKIQGCPGGAGKIPLGHPWICARIPRGAQKG